MSKPHVIGVIPARFSSTRFPGKPLAQIAGKAMILWVAEGCRSSQLLDEVIVATDDERIRQAVAAAGFQVMMTDPNLPSGTDRIYAAISSKHCDIAVNVQGDEPLITGGLIDRLVQPLLDDSQLEMATLAHEISRAELFSENSVKVIVKNNSEALYFSRFPIPYSRNQPPGEARFSGALKHIGLYAYKTGFLAKFCQTVPVEIEMAESLEQLRALALGARIKVVTVKERLQGVDTPEDLAKIEEILKLGSIR